jgi:hypothetical protein
MCTLPVAGASDATSALTGPVLQRPAVMTSTAATVAAGRKALLVRRQVGADLGAPIDLMFILLPSRWAPQTEWVERDCQYSRRL